MKPMHAEMRRLYEGARDFIAHVELDVDDAKRGALSPTAMCESHLRCASAWLLIMADVLKANEFSSGCSRERMLGMCFGVLNDVGRSAHAIEAAVNIVYGD
jgi:hypothetical protein